MNVITTEVIENYRKYSVCTTIDNMGEKWEVWKNENNKIDRLNKPAISFFYKNILKQSFCFKDGQIHSYNDAPAISYTITEFHNTLNVYLWFNNNNLHRLLKPAIVVNNKNAYHNYTSFEAFFQNGKTSLNHKGSFLHYDLNSDDTPYLSEIFFLKNNIESEGFNHYKYNYNGVLTNKKRETFNIKTRIDFFHDNLKKITKYLEEKNNNLIVKDIKTFVYQLISSKFKRYNAENYYNLPNNIYIEKSNKIIMEWRDQDLLHRKDKPARIEIENNLMIEEFYNKGRPLKSIYKPQKLIFDRKTSELIKFEFHDNKVQSYFKINDINPLNINKDIVDLIELNFNN